MSEFEKNNLAGNNNQVFKFKKLTDTIGKVTVLIIIFDRICS